MVCAWEDGNSMDQDDTLPSQGAITVLSFTHSNLHPRNIIVRLDDNQGDEMAAGGVQVTAIIDWEFAGWYPEYWEFVMALNMVPPRGPLWDWVDFLPGEAIGNYPVECAVDCLLDRWLG